MIETSVTGLINGDDLGLWLKIWTHELTLPVFGYAPTRGIAASLVARSVSYGATISLSTSTTGYQICHTGTLLDKKIRDIYYRDCDLLVQSWQGVRDQDRKIVLPALGPWSFLASIELANGKKTLSDKGASRDITQTYIAGMGAEQQRIADMLGISKSSVHYSFSEPYAHKILTGRLPGRTDLETISAVSADRFFSVWDMCYLQLGECTQIFLPHYDNEIFENIAHPMIIACPDLPQSTVEKDACAKLLTQGGKISFLIAQDTCKPAAIAHAIQSLLLSLLGTPKIELALYALIATEALMSTTYCKYLSHIITEITALG